METSTITPSEVANRVRWPAAGRLHLSIANADLGPAVCGVHSSRGM